jgi:hypothetical protein
MRTKFLIEKCENTMDATEVSCGGVGWIHLAQDCVQWRAVVEMVNKFRVP